MGVSAAELRGQKQFFRLLSAMLGDIPVRMGESKTRAGDAGFIDIPGWRIRVHCTDDFRFKRWWKQATLHTKWEDISAVAYRRGPDIYSWRVLVPLWIFDINPQMATVDWLTEMSVEAFCEVVRAKRRK